MATLRYLARISIAALGCLLVPELARAQPAAEPAPGGQAEPAPGVAPAPTAGPATAPPPGPAALPPPATPSPAPLGDESEKPAPNSVYGELLGAGLVDSVNYERLVTDDLGVRVGLGYWSASAGVGAASVSETVLMFPITASYIGIRAGKHCLELGGGATLAHVSGSVSTFGLNASASGLVPWGELLVGYRIQPMGGAGFQFRVGAMALIGEGFSLSSNADPTKVGVIPWGYISFGASF